MRMEPLEVKALRADQKANWIPGMPELCWKHLLHSNIVSAKLKYGSEAFGFWPEGWNLPEEYDQLCEYYLSKDGEQVPIILKPSMQACGNGIRCITDMSQLPRDDAFLQIKSVAQVYIPNPLLLNGFKVTFRIYVLISSCAPLRAYIYPNGLGRICSRRYTTETSSFQDLFAHLTNYDINKHNMADFVEGQQGPEGLSAEGVKTDGLRTDFAAVMDYLKRQGRDTSTLWHKMKHVVAMTLLAADSKISAISTSLVKYRSTTFEILGFDFLIDQDLNPWILEVNHAPNLEPHTPLETELKRGMIRDALHLVDFSMERRCSISDMTDRLVRAKEALQRADITIDDQLAFQDQNGEVRHFPFSTLTSLEIWTLVESELELQRTGDWQVVFPTASAETDYRVGESDPIYQEGVGGVRNSIAVQFLKFGLTTEHILAVAQAAIPPQQA